MGCSRHLLDAALPADDFGPATPPHSTSRKSSTSNTPRRTDLRPLDSTEPSRSSHDRDRLRCGSPHRCREASGPRNDPPVSVARFAFGVQRFSSKAVGGGRSGRDYDSSEALPWDNGRHRRLLAEVVKALARPGGRAAKWATRAADVYGRGRTNHCRHDACPCRGRPHSGTTAVERAVEGWPWPPQSARPLIAGRAKCQRMGDVRLGALRGPAPAPDVPTPYRLSGVFATFCSGRRGGWGRARRGCRVVVGASGRRRDA